jgi:hypothetical protein
MKIWIPNSLYRIKPFLYLLTAVLLMIFTSKAALTALAIILIVHSGMILLMRSEWRGSGKIN